METKGYTCKYSEEEVSQVREFIVEEMDQQTCRLRQIEENKQAKRVAEKDLLHRLELEGCAESQKKMKLTMEEHYKAHAFVRRYQHRKVYHWDGLEVRDAGFGGHFDGDGHTLGRTLSDTW